ncbi:MULTISPECIES: RcnB family protein [Acinetobacter]|uniref:RcnB family protein n=1 Tax=Acinetobacter TaxID=469 RepID=UPI00201B454A|nr:MULTISPECIES: RcnB family protein [Acinetobacter]MCL6231209.1 RcnB family protein [Acinetobacter amyesii]MCL6234562.1 RcnB family protein [Acinetobacter amyesii]
MYFLTARVSALTIDARQNPQKTKTQQHTKQYTRVKNQSQNKKKAVNPSHDWRSGQKVPSEYRCHRYKGDHNKYKKMSKSGKNQQWIKVNGDYILMNAVSHAMIKIIAG